MYLSDDWIKGKKKRK